MSKLKILLMDPSMDLRLAVKANLEDMGEIAVFETINFKDAELVLGRERPHILITEIYVRADWREGLYFVGETRKKYPGLVIIILTGLHDEFGLARAAENLGAQAFLAKIDGANPIIEAVRKHIPYS